MVYICQYIWHYQYVCHIHFINIWPLLSVHLDADEMVVQYLGHALTLEGFPLHHMTPVTGGVTN